MSASAEVRFAIAGLGGHAEVMAGAIARTDGARLVAGASRTAARAAEFAETHGIAGHSDYAELLERDDVDVLLVATANDQHAGLVVDACRAGLDVLCEKPLALTGRDADAMLAAATESGRSLFVGYYLRFLPIVEVIRDRIAGGAIGRPLDLRVQRYSQHSPDSVRPWRRDLARAGAGVLCDVATHLTDLLSYVTGEEITTVHATARPSRSLGVPEDHIMLTVRLSGGGIATVDAARGVAGGENDLHLHGDAGIICTGPLRWSDEHELRTSAGRPRTFPAGDPYAAEVAGVVRALAGGATPLAGGLDGRRGVRVLTAAIRSLETGATVDVEPLAAAVEAP
jgi:predicted dehydrogenase